MLLSFARKQLYVFSRIPAHHFEPACIGKMAAITYSRVNNLLIGKWFLPVKELSPSPRR